MNTYVYSAKNNAFFPVELIEGYELNGWDLSDAVDVDDLMAHQYMGDAPAGKVRVAGENGLPAWGDIHPPTHEELITIAEQVRQQLLTHADAVMLDWRTELMLGEISDANRAKLSAWLAYKNDVKAVDVATDPEHINWPVAPEE